VLQCRQRLNQPRTPPVNEQRRADVRLDIAKPLQNFAHPFTRSVFAPRNTMPSRACCAAIVVPSLCRENTSAPATNRFKSDSASGRVSLLSTLNHKPSTICICESSVEDYDAGESAW
jgi:hypothetical protein